MSFGIRPGCDGCGACVSACPRGAIRLAAVGAAMPYEVAALECNDCWSCAPVCPRGVLGPDPRWAVCRARGCPLSSRRLSGWACTEGWARCPKCNSALWKPPGSGEWRCARCDLETRVGCPKARMSGATPAGSGRALAHVDPVLAITRRIGGDPVRA
jgi:NAD-dependent dihydropyrimidine dehydrogenase PreA subunit